MHVGHVHSHLNGFQKSAILLLINSFFLLCGKQQHLDYRYTFELHIELNFDQIVRRPTLLEGEALALWLEFTEEEQADYGNAKKKILVRMGSVQFVSMDDFRGRWLRPSESLSVLVHYLRRLLRQAMPDLQGQTHDQLLHHQFLVALPAQVCKQLRAAGKIDNLDKMIERAKLLRTLEQEQVAS